MANEPTSNPPAPQAPVPAAKTAPSTSSVLATGKPGEIAIYRHSNLFYWWPVWFFGFIMTLVTFFGDKHMAIVPAETKPAKAAEGKAVIVSEQAEKNEEVDLKDRDILVLAPNKHHLTHKDRTGAEHIIEPTIFVAQHKSIGTIYVFVLLIVIAITNVHMRGLWSFYVLLLIVLLAIIFAVAGWWETIFARLGNLSIHINMGGYLLISGVLFIIWLINFAVFDRQTYMIFNPGQVRMRLEIGGGETVYDTTGMVVQKQRSDLFRHWILGFGSGDLVIRPAGVANPIEMPNVLRVARKVRLIENLVKEKVVLAQQESS
jgi:hypothetical protein